MTSEAAVPGAVVVRLDRHGERMPGLYVVVPSDVGFNHTDLMTLGGKPRKVGCISLSRLRLATPEERGKE